MKNNQLEGPTGFREWVFAGTPVTPNDLNNGLEATIKSKAHFPDEPGNWAYFSFSTPDHQTLSTSAKAFPKASCNGCHQASAADDWVFTQYYPVLSADKGAGEEAAGGMVSELK